MKNPARGFIPLRPVQGSVQGSGRISPQAKQRREAMSRGFIHILPVILILVLGTVAVVGTIIISKSKSNSKRETVEPSVAPSPSSTIIPTPTPTPTPSPTVTPSPTPKPTAKPTASPTPKPTPKPTLSPVSGPPGVGLSTINVATPKGNFSATVLALNLSNTKMITDSANDSDCANNCPVTPLASYISRNGGFAGVNGTYFCPATYPDCGSKTNSFDFPIYNSRLNHWINDGNRSWGSRSIFYADGSGAHYLQAASDFGGGLNAGVINFPGLLVDGNVQIDDNQSGLADKQKAKGTKVGIGLRDSQNIMVVIAQNVNMQEFAYVFKSLGATAALNLDTGGSTALYYNGRYVMGPGRDLPNAIVFGQR